MTTLTKSTLALIGAVIIGGFIWGAYQYPKAALLAGSSAGTTFNTAKIAAVAVNLASVGANGTSTSILNSDAFDRYVTGVRTACVGVGTSKTAYSGAGLAALTLSIGTSSTAAPAAVPTNLVASPLTIATSTGYFAVSSSTVGNLATTSVSGAVGITGITSDNFVWLTGSYITFATNATNTATCVFGVDYMGS